MKLLFVSRAYHPGVGYGGPVVSLRRICRLLVEAGHDVEVVCTNMAGPGRKGPLLASGKYLVDGVRVRFLPVLLRYHWEGVARKALATLRPLIGSSDIVHVAGARHFLGMVAEALARSSGVPYFVMPEGSIPPRFRNIAAKVLLDALYSRRSLARAAGVIATSADESDELEDWGVPRRKIHVLPPRADAISMSPLGVDELRRTRRLPVDRPVLLWIGRIHPEKGLPVLFDAMRDDRLQRAHLLLAGGSEDPLYERRLREQVERHGLRGRVDFLGWANEKEKSELMKLADLFVFPSRKENFGLAAAEAVASGLPVVVTKGCGLARLVDGSAGIVADYSARSVADAVSTYLADLDLQRQLREGTAVVARSLDWPPVVSRLEEIFGSAVPGPR